MNNVELRKKVHSAMYSLIKTNGVASPVGVLMAIGALSKEKYEDWRRGKVPYLERVCQINLGKLSTVNHEIRAFARKSNLKASWSDYRSWNKDNHKRIRLRFSKSGDEQIERLYATHYVSQQKVADALERHAFQKRKNELAQTIAPCGLFFGLLGKAANCNGCSGDNGCTHADACYQRQCCAERDIKGCWKCAVFPCDKGMFSQKHDSIKHIAFVRCVKEDGVKGLAGHVLRNQDNGLLYSSSGDNHIGAYDGHDNVDVVLKLLRGNVHR